MGIFEKPPGTYWINYHDEKGKRKRVKVGRSRPAAEKLLIKKKEAVRQAKLFPEEHQVAESALTVKELVEKYLPLFERKQTYKDDQRLAQYCIKAFGSTLAKDLKPSQIEAYRIRRLQEVKPATVNRCVAFLKRIYNLAIDDDLALRNPVSKLKMLAENNTVREDWTPEEEAKILAACSPVYRRIFLILLLSGMRGGEFLGRKRAGRWVALPWSQVDFDANVIKLVDTKNGESREVPMGEDIRALMLEQRVESYYSPWVFPGRRPGEPLKRDTAYWALQRACEKAGVPRKRLHSTRHAFCSQLLMAGVDLKTVSEMAGHKTIAVTAQLYGHVNEEHKRGAAAALSARRTREGRSHSHGQGKNEPGGTDESNHMKVKNLRNT